MTLQERIAQLKQAQEKLAQKLAQAAKDATIRAVEKAAELTPPEAAGILRDTELTGDEERIVSALTAAVHRLEELADRRRRDSRQRERLLWAAALSGAGLFIILLI